MCTAAIVDGGMQSVEMINYFLSVCLADLIGGRSTPLVVIHNDLLLRIISVLLESCEVERLVFLCGKQLYLLGRLTPYKSLGFCRNIALVYDLLLFMLFILIKVLFDLLDCLCLTDIGRAQCFIHRFLVFDIGLRLRLIYLYHRHRFATLVMLVV